jgi:hypothetical protein
MSKREQKIRGYIERHWWWTQLCKQFSKIINNQLIDSSEEDERQAHITWEANSFTTYLVDAI